jgi:hypothetical protein
VRKLAHRRAWQYANRLEAALIGYAGRLMTGRYLHSAVALLLAAADPVARRTLELMGDSSKGDVVLKLNTRSRQS